MHEVTASTCMLLVHVGVKPTYNMHEVTASTCMLLVHVGVFKSPEIDVTIKRVLVFWVLVFWVLGLSFPDTPGAAGHSKRNLVYLLRRTLKT